MYDRILIVVGDPQTSNIAVAEGVALAKAHDAEVVFFNVLPRYVLPVTEMAVASLPSPEEFQRDARADASRMLDEARAVADKAGVRCQVVMGSGVDDAECIAEGAVNLRCELIVVASAGRNAVMRLITGSVIPGLITHSRVPVLVCRHPSPGSRIELLAAGDGKPRWRKGSVGDDPPMQTSMAATGRLA